MILKEGKIKEKELISWVAKCKHCGCVFTYDDNTEVVAEGSPESIRCYLVCPFCNKKTLLPLFKRKFRRKL